MINKQKLWFLTLFSLIMVLSVYYVTMPSDVLNTKNNVTNINPVVNINEEDSLSVLRNISDEESIKNIEELKMILTNVNSTIEEKNDAYEKIDIIKKNKSKETILENKIKDLYNLDSIVNISDSILKLLLRVKIIHIHLRII